MADRRYNVLLVSTARGALDGLPDSVQRRIVHALEGLETHPRPTGVTLLTGTTDERIWRLRVGDYRILYEVRDSELAVLVISIGHRREVYRRR